MTRAIPTTSFRRSLFDEIEVRGRPIRNRLWVSPMCQYMAEGLDGMPTAWHEVHYGVLARGGAGLVLVEASAVTPQGRTTLHDLGIWTDEHAAALGPTVDFAHQQGAAIGIQLAHAGRKASTVREWTSPGRRNLLVADGGWDTLAPSVLSYPGLAAPHQMNEDDIAAVTEAFVAAATRAVEVGFDLVEIHAAHGYLLHEFLSPLSNHRTDAYGGDLSNRARFLLEVTDAVRAAVPVPLAVRLSGSDWLDGGLDSLATCHLAAMLTERGADLIDVSSGGLLPSDRIPIAPGYQVPLAAAIAGHTDALVAAVGLITEPVQAEQIIATGAADVVMVGREFLRDPHFVLRAARELGVDVPFVPGPLRRAYRPL